MVDELIITVLRNNVNMHLTRPPICKAGAGAEKGYTLSEEELWHPSKSHLLALEAAHSARL